MNEKLYYADQTFLHPLAFTLWCALAVYMFTCRRSRTMIPIFVLACFVSIAQRVSIVGLDFTLLRLLVIVGWVRVLSRGEHRSLRLLTIDRVLIAYILVSCTLNTVLQGNFGAVVFNLGFAMDSLGMYFLTRVSIRNFRDLDGIVSAAAVIALILVVPFYIEKFVPPHRNLFSVFGGMDEFSQMRQGKIRASGAFTHPIIAGCYWVALLPLFVARLRTHPNGRIVSVLAIIATFVIVFATASSTPLAGLLLVIGSFAFYPFRATLPAVRWGFAGMLVLLHLTMSAPVWHLISRIDLVGGSTGWHRYHLIDAAIHNFPRWAVMGTRSTASWGHQLFDLTNQYVFEGVRGGFLSLALFVALIVLSFRGAGRLMVATRRVPAREFQSYAVGVCFFVHSVLFLAVSYFGQIYTLWYFTLGLGASLQAGLAARASTGRRRIATPPSPHPGSGPPPLVHRRPRWSS